MAKSNLYSLVFTEVPQFVSRHKDLIRSDPEKSHFLDNSNACHSSLVKMSNVLVESPVFGNIIIWSVTCLKSP